ncbi:MAG: hypothetical protein WC865_11625 [Bacteroidales bacterium]
MAAGIYEEPLPCGGKLKVSKTSWKISYYFQGPDFIYNGTFVSVPGNSIGQYISAFKENWAEYEQLKASIPKGGEFTKNGKMGMSIRIGSFALGVCIQIYHMPFVQFRSWKRSSRVIAMLHNEHLKFKNFWLHFSDCMCFLFMERLLSTNLLENHFSIFGEQLIR